MKEMDDLILAIGEALHFDKLLSWLEKKLSQLKGR